MSKAEEYLKENAPVLFEVSDWKPRIIQLMTDFSSEQNKELIEKVIKDIPSNWHDPLLSGEDVPKLPYNCPEIEQLLNGVRDRIKEHLK